MPPHHPEHRYEEISLLAYHFWQQANCPAGEDLKFWLQAEQQLFGKQEPQAGPQTVGNGKSSAKRAASAAAKTPAKGTSKTTRQPVRAK